MRINAENEGRHGITTQGGFTFIELMFASALGLLTLSAVVVLLTSQKQNYEVHAQVSEMDQYLRVGMEEMIREVRMAGFGQPTWTVWDSTLTTPAYGIAYTVQVTQGAGTNPDIIDIIGAFDVPSGALTVAANATTVTLDTGQGAAFNTTDKSDAFLGDGQNVRVTGVSGDVLTIDTDPATVGDQGLATTAPIGTDIYLVKHHTYALSAGNLTRDENLTGPAMDLGENIDALQATFADPMLTVTLGAKTARADPTYTHPTTGDGHRRRTQTSNIQVRNL